MKNLIITLFSSIFLISSVYAAEQKTDTAGKAEIKEVCTPKKDKAGKEVKDKAGKVVQECKKIKVRKKLEGTAIPEKK
jgi:hypothetical protein